MKLGANLNIDRSTIILLAVTVALVLLVAIFMLVPAIDQYGSMTGEIPRLQKQLQELRELKTLSHILDKRIIEFRNATPEYARGLDTAQGIKSGQVIGHIEKIAVESSVRMRDNQFNIVIDQEAGRQHLRLSSVFQGSLDNLRLFLLKLLQQPYIREFVELSIESGDNGFMLKLHFVVEIS